MNWISNVVRPRIRSLLTTKRDVPDNMWVKCPESGQMVFHRDLEANQFVVPGSNYHMRMTAVQRLAHAFDDGAYDKVALPTVPLDPLRFRDGRRYVDRLKDAKTDTQLEDAVLIGDGRLDGSRVTMAAQDFKFMGGSLGMAAGEAVIAGMLHAVANRTPFILFAASGGARMQEGILSLMQMPRTTIAVQRLRDARLPYIVVLTDPTTGGVTASYAMLGDIHIAEPGALICFAGPRVIQQTIREQLPEGFQRAEYLLAHGMIDMVVHRHEMRATLARVCRLLTRAPAALDGKVVNGHADRAATAAGAASSRANGKVDVLEAEPVEDAKRFSADGAGGKGKSAAGEQQAARTAGAAPAGGGNGAAKSSPKGSTPA